MTATRVTMVSYDGEPPLGGQGVVVRGMRAALRRRGLRVHTITGHGDNAIAVAHRTWRAPLDFSLQLNRYPRILVRASPHVVHIHGGPGGVLFWKPLEVPIVYTAHHTYRQAHPRGVKRALGRLEARCYAAAAMVLAVSNSTAEALLEMGMPAQRVEVLPNGVDAGDEPSGAREPGRVLFVARLEPEKGVRDALRVMRSLASWRAAVRGVVVGDGSMAGEVRRAVAASGGRIEHLGAVDAPTLRREYARAALVLMPSRYEGLGMVALEAQAAGTPVVGYDVDGLRDAVRAGGRLVPAGDVLALRDACAALLRDAVRCADLGAAGRDQVRREHSWDGVAARLVEIYAEVVAQGGPPPARR